MLLDPYGGPHVQTWSRHAAAYLSSQWFADQGFAVVVVDGRGTPGRGSEWERAVHLDLATPVLDDQVDALHAGRRTIIRSTSTGSRIRGWSFGGYLAALAVLRRPDVFHAAVAGAPVTDGGCTTPTTPSATSAIRPSTTRRTTNSSLLPLAGLLTRPLLLIHGLADDNVVAAHTLQLSSALLAAGKPHEVLPLVGRHPHDAAGGRGREPAPAPARLPARALSRRATIRFASR